MPHDNMKIIIKNTRGTRMIIGGTDFIDENFLLNSFSIYIMYL